jgi:hypothetical protein
MRILIEFDSDPRHSLTHRGIVTAIANLEISGTPMEDQMHVLNHWR